MIPPTRRGGAALALILSAGCALNPVTGKRELALVSESQEIEMGKQGAADVARTIGLYRDAAVQSYVSRVGLALAARTERPALPWSFQVVDDASVNAFAFPGGFIFITRGLLTHLTNEAELASILGHESGHVAARHSVQQISRAQVAGLGLGIGSMLSSGIRTYSGALGAGLGLMFLKFGRDDELQADQLGLRYAMADGYDVRHMIAVFQMLDQLQRSRSGGRLPEWQATHPDPGNRIDAIERHLAGMPGSLANAKVGRDAFLAVTNGMVYGENPRQGFFRGTLFLHPDLAFQFQFPDGWTTRNASDAVIGVSAAQNAIVALRGAAGTAAEASRRFFEQEGLEAGSVSRTAIHGLTAWTGEFSARTEEGTLRGIAAFIEHKSTTYEIAAYTTSDAFSGYRSALQGSIASFDNLTDRAALAVQPLRLELGRAPRAMTLAQFHAQYPSAVSLDELALINRLVPGAQLSSGQSVKRVVGSVTP